MLISSQSGQTGAFFFVGGFRLGSDNFNQIKPLNGRKTNKQSISITSIMRWNNLWAIKALLSSGIPFISVARSVDTFFSAVYFLFILSRC